MTDFGPLTRAFNRGLPTPVPNLVATRGDVIKLGKQRAVVTGVEWRGESWAFECFTLVARATRLGSPRVSYFPPGGAPEPIGRWEGALDLGASGRISLNPSDGRSTVPTPGSPTSPKEGTMATTTPKRVTVKRGSTKAGAKAKTTTAKTAAAKKAGAAKASTAKAKATGSKRTAADVDKLVPKFKSALKGGATMRALKEEHGFSDDGPIRASLFRAGFDSKGAPLSDAAKAAITGSGASLAKKLVKEREAGTAWYALAHRTGKTEAEVKAIVAEAGGPTGRVYSKTDKPKAAGQGR